MAATGAGVFNRLMEYPAPEKTGGRQNNHCTSFTSPQITPRHTAHTSTKRMGKGIFSMVLALPCFNFTIAVAKIRHMQ